MNALLTLATGLLALKHVWKLYAISTTLLIATGVLYLRSGKTPTSPLCSWVLWALSSLFLGSAACRMHLFPLRWVLDCSALRSCTLPKSGIGSAELKGIPEYAGPALRSLWLLIDSA
jgi:hypothetical protein